MERNPWGGVVLLILMVLIVAIYLWHHKHNVVGKDAKTNSAQLAGTWQRYVDGHCRVKDREHLKQAYYRGENIRVSFVCVEPKPSFWHIWQRWRQKRKFSKRLSQHLTTIAGCLGDESNDTRLKLINGIPDIGVELVVLNHYGRPVTTLGNDIWGHLVGPPRR